LKLRIALPLVLILGIVLGSLGTLEWCDRGHCGDPERSVEQDSSSTAAETYGAGSQVENPASTEAEATPTRSRIPGSAGATPAPPVSTAGTDAWDGAPHRCQANPIEGLAIIGDSAADEYRADNPRGGEYGDTTFNWLELLARERGIDVGLWGERPEPRRGGYAYNWARSGATSETLLRTGQHTGVVQQIEDGHVSHVIVQIGVNDFYYNDVALQIYAGDFSGDALDRFLDQVVANVEEAVQAIKIAGESKVILSATPDFVLLDVLPEVDSVLPNEVGRQRIIDAFAVVNEGLKGVAEREQVAFFDINTALQDEMDERIDPEDPRYFLVGGERIDLQERGNEPHYTLVDDEYAHAGTVFSGLIANVFIEEMNATFGTNLDLFSDEEILRIAGIQ